MVFKVTQFLTMNETPPSNAVAFVKLNGFWYWKMAGGGYRTCTDWREWRELFGGECELSAAVDMSHEPSNSEFIELMEW